MVAKIKLGKEYPLRFDFNALAEFEAMHGQSCLHVVASGNIGFLAIRNLVWAALITPFSEQGEAVAPAMIGVLLQDEWIDKGKSTQELVKLVMDAVRESGLVSSKKKPEEKTQGKTPAKKRSRARKS